MYDFYTKVLHAKTYQKEVHEIQKQYLSNKETIQFTDPKTEIERKMHVNQLTRKTWAGFAFSTFLIRLIDWLNVQHLLETGTALGINASFLSYARSIKTIHTIEGSEDLAKKARQLIKPRKGVKLNIIHGNIYDVFENYLTKVRPELVFLDADHRSEAVEFYIDRILEHAGNIKCIVIHDINWSTDMKNAWEKIIKDPRFSLTIDIFHAGLIFPFVETQKQHFTLKN